MARKKRSEKTTAAVRPAPAPPEVAKVAGEILEAFCPVCGRTVPQNRALKVGGVVVGKVGYFESIDWDPNKPFGVAKEASGRGSLANFRYINPDEAPELFEVLKARLIQALKEWINKGWLSPDEISQF